jgi:hypothetical protein
MMEHKIFVVVQNFLQGEIVEQNILFIWIEYYENFLSSVDDVFICAA